MGKEVWMYFLPHTESILTKHKTVRLSHRTLPHRRKSEEHHWSVGGTQERSTWYYVSCIVGRCSLYNFRYILFLHFSGRVSNQWLSICRETDAGCTKKCPRLSYESIWQSCKVLQEPCRPEGCFTPTRCYQMDGLHWCECWHLYILWIETEVITGWISNKSRIWSAEENHR